MIKTVYQVSYEHKGEVRVVLETEDLREAKKKDAEIEMVASLLVEAERLAATGQIELPKGVKFDQLERTLEDMFLSMAANQEGMKRAMKGQAYTLEEEKPAESKPKSKAAPRKKAGA